MLMFAINYRLNITVVDTHSKLYDDRRKKKKENHQSIIINIIIINEE